MAVSLQVLLVSLLVCYSYHLCHATCLYNAETDQYLVATPNVTHDSKLREVTTIPFEELPNNIYKHWYIMKYGSLYLIRNSDNKEYLHVTNDFNSYYAYFRRKVYTYVGHWDIRSNLGLWAIEPDGPNVFIRNVAYDAYLYDASSAGYILESGTDLDLIGERFTFLTELEKKLFGKVYAWVGGHGRKVSSGRWTLVQDC